MINRIAIAPPHSPEPNRLRHERPRAAHPARHRSAAKGESMDD
jgi:hypothetical protein